MTPRELAMAQVKESDEMIKGAHSMTCIAEGFAILKEGLLRGTRASTIANVIPTMTNLLRNTTIAMHMGPILETYQTYTATTTDIQVTSGESEQRSFFFELPTREGAIITITHPNPNGIPDNFLTVHLGGIQPSLTFIAPDQYVATILTYLEMVHHKMIAPTEAWQQKQLAYIVRITTEISTGLNALQHNHKLAHNRL